MMLFLRSCSWSRGRFLDECRGADASDRSPHKERRCCHIAVEHGSSSIEQLSNRAVMRSASVSMLILAAMVAGAASAEVPHEDRERGLAFLEAGDLMRAITCFNAALWRDPNDFTAYTLRGASYALRCEYQMAIDDLSEAIRLSAGNAQAYYLRSRVYTITGACRSAIDDERQWKRLGFDPVEDRGVTVAKTSARDEGRRNRELWRRIRHAFYYAGLWRLECRRAAGTFASRSDGLPAGDLSECPSQNAWFAVFSRAGGT